MVYNYHELQTVKIVFDMFSSNEGLAKCLNMLGIRVVLKLLKTRFTFIVICLKNINMYVCTE